MPHRGQPRPISGSGANAVRVIRGVRGQVVRSVIKNSVDGMPANIILTLRGTLLCVNSLSAATVFLEIYLTAVSPWIRRRP